MQTKKWFIRTSAWKVCGQRDIIGMMKALDDGDVRDFHRAEACFNRTSRASGFIRVGAGVLSDPSGYPSEWAKKVKALFQPYVKGTTQELHLHRRVRSTPSYC